MPGTSPDLAHARPSAGFAAAVVAIALVILGAIVWLPVESGVSATWTERNSLMDAWFGALPKWVLMWMSIQRFIMLGCLWFVIWHREARVYLLAVVLSHVISYTEIAYAPVERLGLGLVSLNHLVWIPALVLMLANRSLVVLRTPYGLWYHAALFQLIFSLIFDLRDSALYLFEQFMR